MRYLTGFCVIILMGCAPEPTRFDGAQSPLTFDAETVSRSNKIAVLIPGALAPIDIFSPANVWADEGYALVYYRFPGLDGLPLDHKLGIENAASKIAAFANKYPGKSIRILGYSTGGPIAILAAEEIEGDVKVAAMSSAVERAGGTQTTFRATVDIIGAAARVKSLKRNIIWLEYYRTLLFGRKGLRDPALNARADRHVAEEKDDIILPEGELPAAHSDDLRSWTLRDAPRLSANRLRFFIGLEDPVFSTLQTRRFASLFGAPQIVEYPDQGHLLFLTQPQVFEDVFAFFEEPVL